MEKINGLNKNNSIPFKKNRTSFLADNEAKKLDFVNKKLVVYTVVTGGYDELTTPEYINVNFDYVAFTDDENLKSDFWDVRLMEDLDLDLARKSRNYKILPYLYLSEYDYSLYVDANVHIIGDLEDFILKNVKNSPILCITHNKRNCAYKEAKTCIELGKDYEAVISKQVDKYRSEGFPENQGLIAGGVIFREHNDYRVIKLMDDWYHEIINRSKRDQLSFNYVCWKNGFEYDFVYFWDAYGKYFQLNAHKVQYSRKDNHELEEYGLNRMWGNIILPIIEAVNADYIVEIGSDTGSNTINILEYCVDKDARMTAIDPFPKFDINEFKAKYGDRFEIFEELSLSRLPLLHDYDVILVDGDHNWYTVYNELKVIEMNFKSKKFPVVFLHDVGWPYARRDLYYNPENIPDFYKQPYKKQGIYPGESNLIKEGGMNYTLCNSIYENNPRNGVLTALEDFVEESDFDLSFKLVNSFHGLGILYPDDYEIEEIVEDTLNNSGLVGLLEEERIKISLALNDFRRKNNSIQKNNTVKIKNLENQLKKVKNERDRLKNQLSKRNSQIRKTKAVTNQKNYQNKERISFIQRFTSRFPTGYILLNMNETGFKDALTNIKGFKAIKDGELLDTNFYLKNNGDVRKSGMDPILHYMYHGYMEGRKPSPAFDANYYLEKYMGDDKLKISPLVHYALYGKSEGFKTKPETKKIFQTGIKGNFGVINNVRVIVSGWLAKIGDNRPREALIKIDGQTFEITGDLFREDLKKRKINEGNHAFEFFVPYPFVDGKKHRIELIDKDTGNLIVKKEETFNQRRNFQDFSGFLVNSLLSPIISTPFMEQDKRCFATMENIKRRLVKNTQGTKDLPLVSVILHIKSYNAKVQSSVDSVLNQTYPHIQLIVVSDEEEEGLSEYYDNNDDITFLPKPKGSESLNARNRGLKAAKGEYVAYLDSMNTWDPHYLEAMIGAFLELPDAEAVYCGQLLFKTYGSKPYAVRYGSLNRSLLNNRNYIDLNSFCHKNAIINDVGYFDEKLGHHADWDWIMRVVETSQVYSIPVLLSNCYDDSLSRDRNHRGETLISLREKQKERNSLNNQNKKLTHNVSIIIPSYEALEDIKECITAITDLNSKDFIEIVVVDNASNYDVVTYLKELEAEGRIKLILNDVNYGFTYAVKQGIAASKPGNDILILNNDAILNPGAIATMQKTAYEKSDCGLVVPQQVLIGNGSRSRYSVPYADTQFEFDVNASKLYNNIIDMPFLHDGNLLELNFAPFFCVYIKRDVYERSVGLDDELGRHTRSDRIFCFYIKHVMNLKIYHDSRAKVYHKLNKSTGELRDSQSEFEIMVEKNQWDPVLAEKLGYKNAVWDV